MSFNNASAPSWQAGSNTWQQSSEPVNPMPSWQQPSRQLGSQQSWQQPSGQIGAPPVEQNPTQQNQQQSMLPVPYQGGMELQPEGHPPTISLQLVPQQAVEHLLPAEPINPEVVHVPPTFIKQRPIVPRRRVISGFLSMLIVMLLLCSGAGYYAKTSGTWDSVVNLYTGGGSAPNINTGDTKIPDPPQLTAKDSGPARDIIQSVSLASSVDKQSHLPIQPMSIFTPGQTFYLTFIVQPPKGPPGTVTTKWYTNNIFYRSVPLPNKIAYDSKNISTTNMTMQFRSRLSGYVELYWNDQFAQRRYFVVR